MNDIDLQVKLTALHQGDKNALEEIYNELKTPIFTIILRITQNQTLSEDILQDFFVKLYLSPPRLPLQKPRAYLFQMARNLAIDNIRQQLVFTNIDDYDMLSHNEWDKSDEKLDLEQAFHALTLLERQIVTMHINGGLKFREIAPIVEKPLGTVLWQYQRAIKKLQTMLNGGVL